MSETAAPIPDTSGQGIQGGRGPAPEIVGAALAVVVLAVVGTSILAGAGRPAITTPSASPVASQPVVAEPSVAPPVDPGVVALLGSLNQQIAASGQALQKEVDRATLRTADVRSLIQQLNSKIALGAELVAKLGGFLGPDEPGGRLAALYDAMGATASDTLGASLQNAAAYRAGAGALIKQINQIPALQKAIEDLVLVPPSPTPAPTPSPAPPSASPPPATPTPPRATPSPTGTEPSGSGGSPSPSPSVVLGDEQLTNADFEEGVGPPWTLLVAAGSTATVSPDTAAPASGKTAARLDITTGSPAYGGISLQQAGLHIEAGGAYVISLSTRAAAVREVRVRITSSTGDSYLTRVLTTGVAWTKSSIPFTAPVTDPEAVLAIDFGRWDQTTWVDAVSFRRSVPGP